MVDEKTPPEGTPVVDTPTVDAPPFSDAPIEGHPETPVEPEKTPEEKAKDLRAERLERLHDDRLRGLPEWVTPKHLEGWPQGVRQVLSRNDHEVGQHLVLECDGGKRYIVRQDATVTEAP